MNKGYSISIGTLSCSVYYVYEYECRLISETNVYF